MQKREVLFVAWAAFIVSFGFVLISIWNNDDWALIDRGYYTICLGWLTFSVFALVNLTSLKQTGVKIAGEFIFFSWLSTIAAFGIGMISINNTDWILMEKGYYWMGLLFTAYTTYMLVNALRVTPELVEDESKSIFTFAKKPEGEQ